MKLAVDNVAEREPTSSATSVVKTSSHSNFMGIFSDTQVMPQSEVKS